MQKEISSKIYLTYGMLYVCHRIAEGPVNLYQDAADMIFPI
ncbi:hypothetical protein B4144_3861 [Bacillus atrophaeus]|nr:hypothetical protein B4144_3861 [Bacillus atrophaeus]